MPRVVGQTERGDPVLEVRSVRMVLRDGATHFSRLVTCTNCGREVPGAPVLSAGDLDRAPGPFVCSDCAAALKAEGANPEPVKSAAPLPAVNDDGGSEPMERMAEAIEHLTERLDQLQAGIDGEATRAQSESAELRQAVTDVRAAIPAPAEDVSSRLQAVEKQAQRNTHEMSEIGELHAALDAGLGILRSEIVDVRSAMKRVSDGQADLDDRLETFFRASLAPGEEPGRGRKGRKGAEGDRMGTMAAAVEDLLREHRQLKGEVAALAQNTDAATAAAARAANQVSALSPLRSEIKLLHQEIAEQVEAMEALGKRVDERPARKPPAKRASRATKK